MFAISGRNLPRVRSYEEAAQVWEKSHINDRIGGGEQIRGLVNKRDTSKTVHRHIDREGKTSYYFFYHDTSLVVWHEDCIKLKVYDSQSSVTFASMFLPYDISAKTHKGEMYYQHDGNLYQPRERELIFNRIEHGWKVDQTTTAVYDYYVLDKSRAAQIRKLLKPLREHRDLLLRLRNGDHRARDISEVHVVCELRDALAAGELPEHKVRELLMFSPVYDDERLLKNAYLVGGAVKKMRTPTGPNPGNPYQGLTGLGFI